MLGHFDLNITVWKRRSLALSTLEECPWEVILGESDWDRRTKVLLMIGWCPPPDFTLVDLDARSREEGVSPMGSKAEARRVLALRTNSLYTALWIGDLRSRLVADSSLVDPRNDIRQGYFF